jgi:phosphatidylglycerophosphatase A
MPYRIFNLGGGEIFLIVAVAFILCVRKWPDIGSRLRRALYEIREGFLRGLDEFLKAMDLLREDRKNAMSEREQNESTKPPLGPKFTLPLWIAQGFGVGRIPVAPGTFGSVVGVLWFALLLAAGNLWLFLIGMIAGIGLSVSLCGLAEQILGQKDPGCVVLDEIAAMPVCFLAWVGILYFRNGSLPAPEYFFSSSTWLGTVAVFIAFRLFDVAKPWPVYQSQALPGGWGVTVDDVLAAVYVNLLALLASSAKMFLTH